MTAANPLLKTRVKRLVTFTFAGLCLTAFVALPSRATAQSTPLADNKAKPGLVLDKVSAVVNDKIILHSDVMARFAPMIPTLDQIPDARERKRRKAKFQSDLLNELVNEELISEAAREQGLKIEQREVQASIDEIKKQNNLDDNQLAEALRGQGMTMPQYRKDLKRQMIRMRAIGMMVRPKVNVSDEDVRARYDSQAKSPDTVDKVRLQHVMIALAAGATEEQKAEANTKATMVLTKARSGEDFAKLAQDYSDDPSTKNAGGELGWIERGTIASDWEDVVFSMKANETKGPIQGPSGLHLFHVAEVEASKPKSFEASKNEIRTQLFRVQMEKQTQIWIESLREKAHIDIKQAI